MGLYVKENNALKPIAGVAMDTYIKEYIRNQNVLSDYESITLPSTAATAMEMPYDGFITANWSGVNNDGYSRGIYVNGIEHIQSGMGPGTPYDIAGLDIPIKKGDEVYCNNPTTITAYVRYYELRDYSDRD